MEINNKENRMLFWGKYLLSYVISVPLLAAGTYASVYFFAREHTMNTNVTPEQVNATYIGVAIFAVVAGWFVAKKMAMKWSFVTGVFITLLILRAVFSMSCMALGNGALCFWDIYLIIPSAMIATLVLQFIVLLVLIGGEQFAHILHALLTFAVNIVMLLFYVAASYIISRICGAGKEREKA